MDSVVLGKFSDRSRFIVSKLISFTIHALANVIVHATMLILSCLINPESVNQHEVIFERASPADSIC
ncbi:MAG: hypothetical protein Kow0083_07090 [Methylophaga sp.]